MKKNHVLVLGAGFSKAMANAPLTNELFNNFKEIYENEKSQNHSRRVSCFDTLKRVINEMNSNLFNKFDDENKQRMKQLFTVTDDLEGFLTFIDLNLLQFNIQKPEADIEFSGLYTIPNIRPFDLEEAKIGIMTYLNLLLDKYTVKKEYESRLLNWFNKYSDENVIVITFNYDLILEKFLYTKGLWLPHDGYGLEISKLVSSKKKGSSKISILKLHGSISWINDFERTKEDKIRMFWYNLDDFQPQFDGYGIKGTNKKFQGILSNTQVILPSFIKRFDSAVFTHLWKNANKFLNEANYITIIGYSFPEQDSASIGLFNLEYPKLEKVTYVSKKEDDTQDRLNLLFNNNVEYIWKCFEDLI